MDRGTRLITFICGSTFWGKQERPLPEEREAQALNVPGDVRKTTATQYSWFCSCGSGTTRTKCFLFFFHKDRLQLTFQTAAQECKVLLKRLNLALWNMSRYSEPVLHSLIPWVLVRKNLSLWTSQQIMEEDRNLGFYFKMRCHFKVLLSCSIYIHFILVIASWTERFHTVRLTYLQEMLGRGPFLYKISLAVLARFSGSGRSLCSYGPFSSLA